MKVYLYHQGCMYEGGSTESAHKSYESAYKAAKEAASNKSKTMIDFMKEQNDDSYIDYSLIEIEDGFQVASDVYIVIEMEIED